MKKDQYAVILVYSASYAIRAEKILDNAGISCKLIPVPRHLNSDCGVCIQVLRKDVEKVFLELREANVEITEIGKLRIKDYEGIIEARKKVRLLSENLGFDEIHATRMEVGFSEICHYGCEKGNERKNG